MMQSVSCIKLVEIAGANKYLRRILLEVGPIASFSLRLI
jgi:hypothetical protein